MKILIDNNIITKDNIEKINQSCIFELIRKNKMEFFASAKLFNQLAPYLLKIYNKEGVNELKKVVSFVFKLTGKSRFFDSCLNISQKELKNKKGKIQYISCALQNKIVPENFLDITILKKCKDYLSKDFSPEDIKHVKQEILAYQEKNYKLIESYRMQSFDKIEANIKKILQPYNFSPYIVETVQKIAEKDVINQPLTKDEKKEKIYKNLFAFIQEYNLLLQLKSQNKLITDNNFFANYYKSYFEQSFTKIMLDTILFGYSYKVLDNKKSYDDDWPSDNCYVCCAYYTDILLTNDKGYIKDAFKYIYGDTKEIITLDDFIKKYC